MSEEFDFDKYWLSKFSSCIKEIAGSEIRTSVMKGSEEISAQSTRQEVFDWSNEAMHRLSELVSDEEKINIMTGCACRYSTKSLEKYQKLYAETKDLKLVHQEFQNEFGSFMETNLKIEDKYKEEILSRGMGAAGKLHGNKIIATKIPKSAYITEWFEESDPIKKRSIFCHCPRIRDVLDKENNVLPEQYCYCGAGFYKGIWEDILQKEVKVEVLESVIHGGEVCRIAIHLPEDI